VRRLVIEADGGSRGNPGPAAYGAVVLDARTGEVLVELADYLGIQTNNVAEYEGVTAGLAAAREIDPEAQIEARLDSKLVVEQLSGGWSIKNAKLRELALRAKALAPPDRVRFTWVPRAQNARADALANESLDAAAAGRPATIERWSRGAGDADIYVDVADHLGAQAQAEAESAAATGAEPGSWVSGARAAGTGAAQIRAALRGEPARPEAGPVLFEAPGAAGGPAGVTALPTAPPGFSAAAKKIVGWSRADLGAPTTLLMVRHGVTQQSIEHRFSGINGFDPPLIDLGRRQAEAAAEELARRGGADVLVCSPLKRTRQTAAIISERLGMGEPIVIDGIAEADFGEWDSLNSAEVKQRWPDELAAWMASIEVAPPGGESFAQVRRRVDAARAELVERFPRKRVLAVSHVTPIKVLVQQVLEAPASSAYRFELAPCSLTTLAWWADGISTIFGMGESGHLHGVMHETA
jgi:ribonuclease H / adenosylcobalamin/alpha-ribazole phosphatase